MSTLVEPVWVDMSAEEALELSWVKKVFCNITISPHIFKYLSLNDLKNLRSSCVDINAEVGASRRFKNNAVFTIRKKSVASKDALIAVPWKNFRVLTHEKIFASPETKNIILDILENDAQHIDLIQCHLNTSHSIFLNSLSCNDEVHTFENLTSLRLNNFLLNSTDLSKYPRMGVKLFSKLKSLKLYQEKELKFRRSDFRKTHTVSKNLSLIATHCKKLTEFSMERLFDWRNDNDDMDDEEENELRTYGLNEVPVPALRSPKLTTSSKTAIFALLEANSPKISSLVLEDTCVWENKNLKNLKFLGLKQCTIRCSLVDTGTVVDFLNNQPLLENLSITFPFVLPLSVLQCVSDRAADMKKLEIKTCQLGTFEEDDDAFDDPWKLLKDIDSLEELTLVNFSTEAFDESERKRGLAVTSQVLHNLPQSVKVLKLSGLTDFEDDEVWNEIERNISPLSVLENLVELTLFECNMVHQDFELIFAKFTKLRKLEFVQCKEYSEMNNSDMNYSDNESLDTTPPPKSDGNVCISNIKGLRSLTIRQCLKILTLVKLESIKFDFLKELNIGNHKQLDEMTITQKVITSLVTQNPSLEKVCLCKDDIKAPWLSLLYQKIVQDVSHGKCKLFECAYNSPQDSLSMLPSFEMDDVHRNFDIRDPTSERIGGGRVCISWYHTLKPWKCKDDSDCEYDDQDQGCQIH